MPKVLPILEKILPKENLGEEFLLALEISEEKRVKAAIWEAGKEKYKILKTASQDCGGDWEETISGISQLVLKLVEEIKRGVEVKKVIFGLPKSYVEGEQIKEPHLSNLKKLCEQLSLTPLGFVEIPQAIAFLLKDKEGHPQTAILLKLGKSYFSFNIFELGKELGSKTISYRENIAENLSQALKEFSELESFPSKIILYDGEEDLEEARQELLSFPWQKEAGFFHFPKIEILDEDFSISALVAAGASEFTKKISQIPEEEKVSSKELGFLKEEDVAKREAPSLPEKEEKEEKKAREWEEEIEEGIEEESKGVSNLFFSLAQAFRSIFVNITLKPNLNRFVPILFLSVLILGGSLFYLYWISPKATIKLFVEPHSLEEDAEIVLNLSLKTPDEASSQIPGKEVVVEKIGSEKIAVSSKKEVGEPARGGITIYNKTLNLKSFPKAAVIIGPKELKFTLDTDVLVASLSDVIAGTPGKEKAKVTAVKIGPEGNLGAGSDFTFKDFPVTSYAARNEEAFSGGTSREVTVVGKKDQDDLFELLKEKLTNEAKEELEKKLGSSEKLLAETIEGKILEKKFNHDVGEETDELTLDLTMSFKGVSYNEEDLSALLERMAEENAPSGYKFDKEEVEMEVTSIKTEMDKILFNAHFKVKLMPEIKEEELKKKIVGKKLKDVEEYLRTVHQFSGFEVKFASCPPFMRETFPLNSQKIFIEIRPF